MKGATFGALAGLAVGASLLLLLRSSAPDNDAAAWLELVLVGCRDISASNFVVVGAVGTLIGGLAGGICTAGPQLRDSGWLAVWLVLLGFLVPAALWASIEHTCTDPISGGPALFLAALGILPLFLICQCAGLSFALRAHDTTPGRYALLGAICALVLTAGYIRLKY